MPHLEERRGGRLVRRTGRPINEGDRMAELQVQKSSGELHSPYSGRVAELLVQPGGVVAYGAPIGVIEEAEEVAALGAPRSRGRTGSQGGASDSCGRYTCVAIGAALCKGTWP